ncbi:MAG TPA: FGGY family carbohydrate kinase, partial [Elusimicrobiota bacterium]|nr:FGGY family carbohydrate kinase [Elusimicrobiota bacterium]
MASELVLALDQGSSSSRALAFDARGRVAARAQFPVRTFFPRPGWVEHDAEDLFRTQARALDRVLAAIPARARVLGLGLAAQRSTIVLWDSRTGKPVCRAPSWQDARAAAAVAGLASRRDEVHEKTGLYPTPFYSAPKIRFLLDSNAAARRLLEAGRLRIGPVSTYILWRLSEGRIFACDPTMAQRTLLFDIRRGDWDPSLLGFFAIPRAALPALAPTMGPLGSIERSGRKVPVLAAVGDQQAAAAALGSRPGLGVLNLGTGAFFLLNTGTDLRRVPGLLSSVAWRKAGEPCRYLLEGTVHAVGTSLEWLRQLGLLADPRRADAACRRSKQRLWALSAIGGLGAPRWDYSTPSAFWGLDARTRPEDL